MVLRRAQIRGHWQVRARCLYGHQSYRRTPRIARRIDRPDQINVEHADFEPVRIDKKGLAAWHGAKLHKNICQFLGQLPQIIEVDAQVPYECEQSLLRSLHLKSALRILDPENFVPRKPGQFRIAFIHLWRGPTQRHLGIIDIGNGDEIRRRARRARVVEGFRAYISGKFTRSPICIHGLEFEKIDFRHAQIERGIHKGRTCSRHLGGRCLAAQPHKFSRRRCCPIDAVARQVGVVHRVPVQGDPPNNALGANIARWIQSRAAAALKIRVNGIYALAPAPPHRDQNRSNSQKADCQPVCPSVLHNPLLVACVPIKSSSSTQSQQTFCEYRC